MSVWMNEDASNSESFHASYEFLNEFAECDCANGRSDLDYRKPGRHLSATRVYSVFYISLWFLSLNLLSKLLQRHRNDCSFKMNQNVKSYNRRDQKTFFKILTYSLIFSKDSLVFLFLKYRKKCRYCNVMRCIFFLKFKQNLEIHISVKRGSDHVMPFI